MEFLVVLVILTVVVFVITGPLRRPRAAPLPSERLAELEAAREAKYREIRDAALDHAPGKRSEAAFAAVEVQLRREALEILDAIERHGGTSAEPQGSTGPAGGGVPGPEGELPSSP